MRKFNAILIFILCYTTAQAQTVSTFEENVLADSSYYNGDDFSWGFNSGNAHFYNHYDTTFGAAFGYWAEGWAYSNRYDTVTQTSDYATQLYSAKEFNDEDEKNFAIGTQGSRIVLTGAAVSKVVSGFYITNSTYAYNSMKLGDAFAKKFGGASGNDPDYFKVVIRKYSGGILSTDSVQFFLADYRFSDNTQDYIIDEWTWVNLTSLGNVDSLEFVLRSSDVGGFGINTPLYYCIDDFTTLNSAVSVAEKANSVSVSVYPNPCSSRLNLSTGMAASTYQLSDMNGKTIVNGTFNETIALDIAYLKPGIYCAIVNGRTIKFVKE